MKKALFFIVGIAILAGAGYYYLRIDEEVTENTQTPQYATYRSANDGVEFSYRVGPKGYVLEEVMPVDLGTGHVKSIILQRTEDAERPVPQGGEGPAAIVVSIFENTNKQQSRNWADSHVQYSSINLAIGDVRDVVVGGANAIRYMASGLYSSENIVVAHGDSVYVVTGQYMDENSDLRSDFGPLVDSLNFIPKPGQE